MANLDIALRSDNRMAKFIVGLDNGVEVEVELPPDELDLLLLNLGRAREKMIPGVPRKLEPNPVFRNVTRDAVFHVNRPHAVSREIFIAARHDGFGWLAFTLSNESSLILANLISREAQANTPKIIKPDSGLIV